MDVEPNRVYRFQLNCLPQPEKTAFYAMLSWLGQFPSIPFPDAVYRLFWGFGVPYGGVRELNFRACFMLTIVTIDDVAFVFTEMPGWWYAYAQFIEDNPDNPTDTCPYYPFG